MLLTVLVLILKGSSRDFHSIRVLEVVWKLLETVLDTSFLEIEPHDYLHSFRAKKRWRTSIMVANLHQELALREQAPLFVIFLDLKNAFDAMDREQCLDILEKAGM